MTKMMQNRDVTIEAGSEVVRPSYPDLRIDCRLCTETKKLKCEAKFYEAWSRKTSLIAFKVYWMGEERWAVNCQSFPMWRCLSVSAWFPGKGFSSG